MRIPLIVVAGALAGALAALVAYAAVRPAFDADAGALEAPLAPTLALVALPLAGALAVVVTLRRRTA